jgi:hypothetical protein
VLTKERQGLFSVVDSFAIKRRNEFYLIGTLQEGDVQENWFINIPLNKSLAITARITTIEDVEFSNNGEVCKLLIINHGDQEWLQLLLGLNIGSEILKISIDGED